MDVPEVTGTEHLVIGPCFRVSLTASCEVSPRGERTRALLLCLLDLGCVT